MPFTFAHPAAAIPLLRPLGRYGVLSALIIGSCMPDVAYFSPLEIGRGTSHSFPALFWYCLPTGLICYLLFHLVIKGPILALMPSALLKRLGHYCQHFNELPDASWTAVIISLLCGSFSHLIWDSFTHGTGQAVLLFPLLRIPLFTIDGDLVRLYKLLQHLSTILGMLLVVVWIWRWFKQAKIQPSVIPLRLTRHQRLLALYGVILLPIVIGLTVSLITPNAWEGVLWFKVFVRRTVITALPTWIGILFLYSLIWHGIRISNQHKKSSTI